MIALAIRGDATVGLNLVSMGMRVRARLLEDITRLTITLQAKVKGEKLTGQVLHVRTGRLRRSINTRIDQSSTTIRGTVGTNVPYAQIHEYGGVVNVREHLRAVTQVFGRAVTPTTATVRAHTATYPERSFLRSALREMQPTILATLRAGIAEATA